MRVKVVERRHIVGGAAVTEEFHPGFRNSVASYTVSLLNPKIIRDLDLHRHGLTIVERRAQNFLPLPDGRYLLSGEGRTKAEIAKFSSRDAERYDAFAAELERIADVLRDLVLQAPPNVVEGWSARSIAELARAAALGDRLRRLSMPDRRALLDLFTKSAADYLDGWFEAEPRQGALRLRRGRRQLREPLRAGHRLCAAAPRLRRGERQEGRLGPCHRRHGRDQRRPWPAPPRAAGVEIETGAPVREVIVEKGRAAGVALEDGRAIRAGTVAANVNPKLLYDRMVPKDAVAADFPPAWRRWRCGSGTFRMNVALSRLPSFTALPGSAPADHHTLGHHHRPEPRLYGPRL